MKEPTAKLLPLEVVWASLPEEATTLVLAGDWSEGEFCPYVDEVQGVSSLVAFPTTREDRAARYVAEHGLPGMVQAFTVEGIKSFAQGHGVTHAGMMGVDDWFQADTPQGVEGP